MSGLGVRLEISRVTFSDGLKSPRRVRRRVEFGSGVPCRCVSLFAFVETKIWKAAGFPNELADTRSVIELALNRDIT